jgi:hypothetical protein
VCWGDDKIATWGDQNTGAELDSDLGESSTWSGN